MFYSAILLTLQLLPGILQGVGVITPTLSKTIADAAAAVPALVAAITTPGATVPDETIAVLRATQTGLTAVLQDTSATPEALQAASTLLESITEALAAYEAGNTLCDPSTLEPLPTDL